MQKKLEDILEMLDKIDAVGLRLENAIKISEIKVTQERMEKRFAEDRGREQDRMEK